MVTNPRHDGKPLLRLLELYVLRAIDELPQGEQQTLERISPKLQSIYGGNGKWYDAVAVAVHMPPTCHSPSGICGSEILNLPA